MLKRPVGDALALVTCDDIRVTEVNADIHPRVDGFLDGIRDARVGARLLNSQLGKDAEARAAAAEVLRLNPNFSLEVHKQRVPSKDPATLERHIEALRKARLK